MHTSVLRSTSPLALALGLPLLVCGSMSAQGGVTMRAVVASELRAESASAALTVADGTDVTAGVHEELLGPPCLPNPTRPGASFRVETNVSGGESVCQFRSLSSTTTGGVFCGGLYRASGVLDVSFQAATPQDGSLQVLANRLFVFSAGDFRARLLSGRVDFDQSVFGPAGGMLSNGTYAVEVPVRLGGSAETVRVSEDATSGTPLATRASSDVTVTYRDSSVARLLLEGVSCGPRLDAKLVEEQIGSNASRAELTLSSDNVPDWPASIFLFGTTDPGVPIPPTGCLLRTDTLVALFAARDANGRAEVSINLPQPLPSVQLRAQHVAGRVVAGGQEWQTSEALLIRL